MIDLYFGIAPMADVQLTTGGFTGTTATFTALTEAGRNWLEYRGGFACEAITCAKTQIEAGLDDVVANGLTIQWG
jgi:hypothetical protein